MDPNKLPWMSELEPNALDPMFSAMSLQSLLLLSHYPSSSSQSDLTPPPEAMNLFPKRPRLVSGSPLAAGAEMSSRLARQRRQKLGEKTRCLQKLMPWDKKMDQATLLEEAYKYVKFLQSQLSTLLSMPSFSSSSSNNTSSNIGGPGFGELEMLSRNQVLQILVNSPVAQTVMASQGLCVFSSEQLGLLIKLSTDRRPQLLLHHTNMPAAAPDHHHDYKPFN